jgi:hypothetical protein
MRALVLAVAVLLAGTPAARADSPPALVQDLLPGPVKVRLRIAATAPDGTKATITRTLKLTRRKG